MNSDEARTTEAKPENENKAKTKVFVSNQSLFSDFVTTALILPAIIALIPATVLYWAYGGKEFGTFFLLFYVLLAVFFGYIVVWDRKQTKLATMSDEERQEIEKKKKMREDKQNARNEFIRDMQERSAERASEKAEAEQNKK